MMATDNRDPADRPNRIHWPPVIYAIVLATAGLLQGLAPLPAPYATPVARLAGTVLVIGGIIAAVVGILQFRSIGTPVDPTGYARVLAHSGIYAHTRNPMYLGAVLAAIGGGLALPSTWLLLLSIPMAVALTKLAITREEAFLTRRFGDAYLAYKSRVRRWL